MRTRMTNYIIDFKDRFFFSFDIHYSVIFIETITTDILSNKVCVIKTENNNNNNPS